MNPGRRDATIGQQTSGSAVAYYVFLQLIRIDRFRDQNDLLLFMADLFTASRFFSHNGTRAAPQSLICISGISRGRNNRNANFNLFQGLAMINLRVGYFENSLSKK